jgi:hypothetical protein
MQKKYIVLFVMIWTISPGRPLCAAELDTGWSTINIHGFISQGFLKSDHNNFYANTEDGTFQFNEFGLHFSTDLTDRFHAGIQFFARDLGDLGNNKIQVDWAYGDYRWRDWLGFRIGRVKGFSGLYSETRDVDMLRTSIFLPSSLYPEIERDTFLASQGICLYGHVALDRMGSLNYQIGYGQTDLASDSSMVKYIMNQSDTDITNLDMGLTSSIGVVWDTPLEGLRLAGSFERFDLTMDLKLRADTRWRTPDMPVGLLVPHNMNDTEISTLSAEFEQGNLTLMAEYMRFQSHINDNEETKTEDQEGYYGGAAYRFTDWFALSAYYTVYYSDVHDKEGKEAATSGFPHYVAWQKEFVLTTRFDLSDHWTLKFEGHIVNGVALLLLEDNPDGGKEHSFLFAVKTTFNF